MSERLSDINSMFNASRDALGAVIVDAKAVVLPAIERGDSDNLRPFRSIGLLAEGLVARAVSKQRAAE